MTINFIPGKNPELDAFYAIFFIENHLDHSIYPDEVASYEQIGFMVYMDHEKTHYYPCSDEMFKCIIARDDNPELNARYKEVRKRILNLVNMFIEDEAKKDFLTALLSIKFEHETRDRIMIPSRLEKRLFRIFINQSGITDPFLPLKSRRNHDVRKLLNSKEFRDVMDHVKIDMEDIPDSLSDIRRRLEYIELRRIISLIGSVNNLAEEKSFRPEKIKAVFNKKIEGNGAKEFFSFLDIQGHGSVMDTRESKVILWLADEAGEIIVDARIVNYLASIGHKIFFVLKDDPIYTKADILDAEEDPNLNAELEQAHFIYDKNLSKNEILAHLRKEENILVISDGTSENLNLLLTSTTFARAFKESDLIVSRGEDQKKRFFETHFSFTRPVFNISGDDNKVVIDYRPHHNEVIRFSRQSLEKKAQSIINMMKTKKETGFTVMFYSGIIGSIPGKIDEATKIMSVFVNYLEDTFENTFIINPSQYYEPGMDADDLMYMWEIVQRSGYINIWRFQTYEDIILAFKMMNKKVPPEWVGKDATYSTGCTKEMNIALSVLKTNPEMQIIGPPSEKFMRRREYGVGMMYDKTLSD